MASPESGSPSAQSSEPTTSFSALRFRILLVDDADFVHQFLEQQLKEANYAHSIDWCDTFDAGVMALQRGRYDVCLLDYQLGERSGLEFLREAKLRNIHTPIVILTGHGTRELDMQALQAGASDYVVKGEFTAETLDKTLRYSVERARTLERLRDSEERFALAVAGANDGLWDWQLMNNTMHLSARWKSILGFGDDELPNEIDTWWSRIHTDDFPSVRRGIDEHLAQVTDHLESEHRLKHRDGSWRYVLVRGKAVFDSKGLATRMAGSLTDVTNARAHDPLTRLPNRVLFLDRLQQAFHRARRDREYGFAVLFVDLDRFKNVNDSLGHQAGDELLVGIAARLQLCVRSVDTVARLGGDEFVLILDDTRSPDGATRVASRVIEEISKPITIVQREVFVGASVGISMSDPRYEQPGDLLSDADAAMYRAKKQGKGVWVLFDEALHNRAVKVLSVESGIRRAIDDHGLEVHYQAVYDLQNRALNGFEALVRWKHPQRGLVSPGEFLPIAEDSNLIVLVDLHVLKLACQQLKVWHQNPQLKHLTVSVNASRRHFSRATFATEVERILSASGLPPSSLKLEVTESITMDVTDTVREQFRALSALGVSLIVDDFGVGYSSFALLQESIFKGIKIDRSFVKGLTQSVRGQELVRAIINMSVALELNVTAEGVETKEELEKLEELGCESAQGYLLKYPENGASISQWIHLPAKD
jgi:diguanylate cyclase (GGDEF)-like protein/PAS domain S-box-containing protein